MDDIFVPTYKRVKYASLKDAYKALIKYYGCFDDYMLMQIVEYNVRYRDILRYNGLDSLKEHLFREVPELKDDEKVFKRIEEASKKGHLLADYDIQCYDINDPIKIMGHVFENLKDVIKHREICAYHSYTHTDIYEIKEKCVYDGIHICEIYESYPRFDSFDDSDDRSYQNFIFRTHAICEEDVNESLSLDIGCDFCMISESIPPELLPILYYPGDGRYMLLASEKE